MLVSRSVTEFVASVASADEPVPAGGSVAALTGATSAALLALVCSVQQRKQPYAFEAELMQARALQARLLALVDEDAAAFRVFLGAKRAGRVAESGAAERMSRVPLQIGVACADVVELATAIESQVRGMTLGDVRAARQLAAAAKSAALGLAEQDAGLLAGSAGVEVRAEIDRLRGRG